MAESLKCTPQPKPSSWGSPSTTQETYQQSRGAIPKRKCLKGKRTQKTTKTSPDQGKREDPPGRNAPNSPGNPGETQGTSSIPHQSHAQASEAPALDNSFNSQGRKIAVESSVEINRISAGYRQNPFSCYQNGPGGNQRACWRCRHFSWAYSPPLPSDEADHHRRRGRNMPRLTRREQDVANENMLEEVLNGTMCRFAFLDLEDMIHFRDNLWVRDGYIPNYVRRPVNLRPAAIDLDNMGPGGRFFLRMATQITKRIHYLLHAQRCMLPEKQWMIPSGAQEVSIEYNRCTEYKCAKYKDLLRHMANCFGSDCPINSCRFSKKILEHWRECRVRYCLICQPWKKVIERATVKRPNVRRIGI